MTQGRKSSLDDPMVVRAALALDDAVTGLAEAVEQQALHRTRAHKLAAQIDKLARDLSRGWGMDTHGKLLAATARHDAERKFLEKAQRAVARAQGRHARALEAYCDAFDRHYAMMAELRAALDHRQRQGAALTRALQYLFDIRWRAELDAYESRGQSARFDLPESSHDYIPVDIPRFFDLLIQLDRQLSVDPVYAIAEPQDESGPKPEPFPRYRAVSFLEVGCGSGRNLLLARASQLFRLGRSAGFDINPVAIEIGRATFGLGEDLVVADALEYDYGGFDVIYTFRPLSDLALQRRLEARMAATMRKDAYLLAPLSLDLGLYPELTQVGQGPDLWKKTG